MTSLDTWISQNIPDAVMEDASSWLARLDSQQCNAADRLAFARWLAEDPTHRWAFEELSEVWARLHTLVDVGEQMQAENVTRFPPIGAYAPASEEVPKAGRSDWSTLAVSVIIAAGVVAHLLASTPVEQWTTGNGETQVVTIDDGTEIELNARTSISVRIDDRQREVELIQGEAVFDVKKDDRPFVVRTEHGTVAALGTVFAVSTGSRRDEVTVLEGAVSVSSGRITLPLTQYDGQPLVSAGVQSSTLLAGDGAEISAGNVTSRHLGNGGIEQQLSWRSGFVVFSNEPLSSALAEMSRYTDTSVHIADRDLGGLRISGRFSTHGIDDFLSQLSDKYQVTVDAAETDWVVLRSKPIPR